MDAQVRVARPLKVIVRFIRKELANANWAAVERGNDEPRARLKSSQGRHFVTNGGETMVLGALPQKASAVVPSTETHKENGN
jgi:hypothetical protein